MGAQIAIQGQQRDGNRQNGKEAIISTFAHSDAQVNTGI